MSKYVVEQTKKLITRDPTTFTMSILTERTEY